MKFTEPIFIESCEMNYAPIGVTGLTLYIKAMNNIWQLAILSHLPKNEWYVYVYKFNLIEGYRMNIHIHGTVIIGDF